MAEPASDGADMVSIVLIATAAPRGTGVALLGCPSDGLRTPRAGQRVPCVDARAAKAARAYCARAEAASISVSRALFDGVLLLVSYTASSL